MYNACDGQLIVLGAGSLVLKTVPQKVVETHLRMEYADFEAWVFWFTMAVIGYVGFITLMAWPKIRTSNHKHQFISEILESTSIRKGTG